MALQPVAVARVEGGGNGVDVVKADLAREKWGARQIFHQGVGPGAAPPAEVANLQFDGAGGRGNFNSGTDSLLLLKYGGFLHKLEARYGWDD